MKLLGNTKNKIIEDTEDENVPPLEITEVLLVHCNIVHNDYQQSSRVLYKFVPNKSFGQLLDISPKISIFLNIYISIFLVLSLLIFKYGLLIKILNYTFRMTLYSIEP